MWFDKLYRWRGRGSILLAGVGTKGVLDMLRILSCLRGGVREVLLLLALNFNDENTQLRRRARGVPALWPRELPVGAAQGFLRKHKDHSPEVARIWRRVARWMTDEARRAAHAMGNPVSVVLISLSSWAGHTPPARFFAPLLAGAFSDPTIKVGLLEVPNEPALLSNMGDLGTDYPDPEQLGLDAVIITKRPAEQVQSSAQDWNLAFGLAVLIGSRQMRLIHQPAAGDVLATLARFSSGFIRTNFGLERVPLLPWPFRCGPFWRISRLPLPREVGSAIAEAVQAAILDGANPELPWLLTVGVPLHPRSRMWRNGQLPSESLEEATAKLGAAVFPTNIQVVWSSLLSVPEYDNRHAPIATMVLWPSEHRPDPLIAAHLPAGLVLQAEIDEVVQRKNGAAYATGGVVGAAPELLPQHAQ